MPLEPETWYGFIHGEQWSFRETGTMGTLVSQAEINVWVLAPATRAADVRGYNRRKNLTLYMQNPAIECIFAGKRFAMRSQTL